MDLTSLLNRQVSHEFFASINYEALAVWCQANEYNGFAGFFRKQADEEREHARRFADHMDDRGMATEIEALDAPKTEFKKLIDVALHAQALERRNSELIAECYAAAVSSGNPGSLPFLLEFINEQVEEESWAESMVVLVRRADCPGSAFDLDRHIEKVLGT